MSRIYRKHRKEKNRCSLKYPEDYPELAAGVLFLFLLLISLLLSMTVPANAQNNLNQNISNMNNIITGTSRLSLDRNVYGPNEMIIISLYNPSPNSTLRIYSESNVYKYSGLLKKEVEFYAKESGNYSVELINKQGELVDQKDFRVLEHAAIENPNLLWIDKKEYALNKPVLVHINISELSRNTEAQGMPDKENTEDTELLISSDTEVFKYLELLTSPLPFIPRKLGSYRAEIRRNFRTIATAEFIVKNATKKSKSPAHKIDEPKSSNTTPADENESASTNRTYAMPSNMSRPVVRSGIFSENKQKISELLSQRIKLRNSRGRILNSIMSFSESAANQEANINGLLEQKAADSDLQASSSPSSAPAQAHSSPTTNGSSESDESEFPFSFSELKTSERRYDIELHNPIKSIKRLSLRNVDLNKASSLGIEELPGSKLRSADRNLVSGFAINPEETEFTHGTITKTAKGDSLYKCKDWDFDSQQCMGEWKKIKELTPGKEYEIRLTKKDPGFGEEGVLFSKFGYFQTPGGTGNLNITGVGFRPELIIFHVTATNEVFNQESTYGGAELGWGHGVALCNETACRELAQSIGAGSSSIDEHDAASSTQYSILQVITDNDADAFVGFINGTVTSTHDDGFNVRFDAVQEQEYIIYEAYNFPNGTEADIGSFENPSGTGTQSVTTGFRPNFVNLITTNTIDSMNFHRGIGSTTSDQDSSFGWSYGLAANMSGSIRQRAVSVTGNSHNINGDASASSSSEVIHQLFCDQNGNIQTRTRAALDSFDANGFTLDFTAVPSGSYDQYSQYPIVYIAINTRAGGFNASIGHNLSPSSTGKSNISTGFGTGAISFVGVNNVPQADGEWEFGANVDNGSYGWSFGGRTLGGDERVLHYTTHSDSVNAHASASSGSDSIYLLYADNDGSIQARDRANIDEIGDDYVTLDWTNIGTTTDGTAVPFDQDLFLWYAFEEPPAKNVSAAIGSFNPSSVNQGGSAVINANCTPEGGTLNNAWLILMDNQSGSMSTTPDTMSGSKVYANTSSYYLGSIQSTKTRSFRVTGVSPGSYNFRARCNGTEATGNSTGSLLLVNDTAPVITINSVEGDATEIYIFSDQTPVINATITDNGTCYVSEYNESFAEMKTNNRQNCGAYTASTPQNCEYTNTLNPGTHTLYMACNDTQGHQNNQSTLASMDLKIVSSYFKMELQKFTDITTSWQTKSLLNDYLSPVVIVTPEPNASWSTSDPPFGANIRSAGSESVDIRITNPDRNYGSGTMPGNNIVYMLVVEEGYWNQSNSGLNFTLEAKRFDSASEAMRSDYNTSIITDYSVSVNLDSAWGSTNKVFLSTAALDNEDSWISAVMFENTNHETPPGQGQTSGIRAGTSSAQVNSEDDHAQEEINLIALESGTHYFRDLKLRAFRSPDTVEEYSHSTGDVSHGFGEAPVFGVCSMVASDGADGGWSNWKKSPFLTTTLDLYIGEDRYVDTEVGHTHENVDIVLANQTSWSYESLASLSASSGFISTPEIDQAESITIIANCSAQGVTAFNTSLVIEDNSTGEWKHTPESDIDVYANTTSYSIGTLAAGSTSDNYNFRITALLAGNYSFRVRCTASNTNTTAYSQTDLLEVNDIAPVITINSVGGDTTEVYNFTDQTPVINATINENASCYVSEYNESFAEMKTNNRQNCGAYTASTPQNCEYTNTLNPGNHTLYMACNDTQGHQNNQSTSEKINVKVLCDSHADCSDNYYCNYEQECVQDELAGYTCENLAYSGNPDDEVCGNGTNSRCVNDSSYSYTGWYCTADENDCVYNNQGRSHDLGETLCIAGTNDYRNCSSSNLWGTQTSCAEQFDPYNQSATYHSGEYCAYYASAQTCVNGTGGSCSGNPTDCNPYIYNQTANSCGSSLDDCDLGCGAECDQSKSTAPELSGGTCYYDRSCNNSCGWSESSEQAPLFCIDDNNGGSCAYSDRTNPTSAETCYWNRTCNDGSGAELKNGTGNNLRADYCDYCNASGNQSGQYAPAPNASCRSGCANNGTMYYDSGGTPADRSDDCSNGTTTIMSDTLTIGDVWNASGPALCNDTECDSDCGTLDGVCNAGVCECTDNDNPVLKLISPGPEAWDSDGTVTFVYNVTDLSSGIENCSLLINGAIDRTNTSINESQAQQSFTKSLGAGEYNWSIMCYDNSSNHNMNESEQRTIGTDSTPPILSDPYINGTQFDVNQKICIRVQAVDGVAGWWNPEWKNRKEINITNPSSTSLSSFPAYLNISKEPAMKSNYDDLRFISGSCGSGSTTMDYEIESSDSNNAEIWIRIPSMAPGTNQICMYYNNSGAGSGENPEEVWDEHFLAVYHFQNNLTGSSNDLADSTGNSNHGTSSNMGSSNSVSGITGTGYSFDGSSEYLLLPDLADGKNQITVEYWVKDPSYDDGRAYSSGGSGASQLLVWPDNSNGFDSLIDGSGNRANGGAVENYVGWNHHAMTYNGSLIRNFENGGIDGTASFSNAISDQGSNDYFGRESGGTYFSDTADEVRVSDIGREPDWINMTYQLMKNQDSHVSISSEESVGSVNNSGSSGINTVKATIRRPGLGDENLTLSDSSTTSCDQSNGDNIYSKEYNLIFGGTYNWDKATAFDQAGNSYVLNVDLSWDVTTGGATSAEMSQPASNLEINESDSSRNYSYQQTCNVTCTDQGSDCKDMQLFAEYHNGTEYYNINTSTNILINDENSYSCGNLSSQSAAWWNQSYLYRKKITISKYGAEDIPENYTFELSVNTSGLISQGKMQQDCDDLRIVYWNSTDNIELDRTNTSSCNAQDTAIAFKAVQSINSTSTNYYLYYGNDTVTSPPENKTRIFYFWEGFEDQQHDFTSGNLDPSVTTQASKQGTYGLEGYGDMSYYRAVTSYSIDRGILMEAWVRPLPSSTTSLAALEFGANSGCGLGEQCGYQVLLDQRSGSDTTADMQIRKDYHTDEMLDSSTASTIYENQWYYIQAYWKTSGNITFLVFNSTMSQMGSLSASNSDYTSGGFGPAAYQNASWDDIKVTLYLDDTPSASLGEEKNKSNYDQGANSTCTHTFNITSGTSSGNHIWPVRCKALSSNSAASFSGSVNLTINDHPYPNITYPYNNTWYKGVININASESFDSDGTISTYTFQYDNNTDFSSPGTLYSGASSNCTWNTNQDQNQCENNTLGCYLRVRVTDDDGLQNTTHITLGFDTHGPSTTLNLPRNSENITTNTFIVNASATDYESGVDTVIFEYRQNSSDTWTFACDDSRGPVYYCEWNLTELPDGNKYQVRAYANDTLGNTGPADAHTNITVDRRGPVINLESPADDNYTSNASITFYYNATDIVSGINSCSLIIDREINDTDSPVQEGQTLNFTAELSEGEHTWGVNCTDTQGFENSSEERNITVDLSGPVTTLDRPVGYENISGVSTYKVNASATDSGIGNISTVTFEYRKGGGGAWSFACKNSTGPVYECDWSIGGLADGTDYQVRAWANDTLGNNGTPDSHINITLDNNPPTVTLISPKDNDIDGDGDLLFRYSATDTIADVSNCYFIWEGSVNQTETSPITQGQEYQFELYNLSNGNYTWTVNCTDSFGQMGTGGKRNITIDIRYEMNIRVDSEKSTYYQGNQETERANITSNTTDYYNNSLNTKITTDIIKTKRLNEKTAPWWNTNWSYRKTINISNQDNSNALEPEYTVQITLDTTGSKFLDNGNDVRIVWWNNNTWSYQELDRINTTSFNSGSTEIEFSTQHNISPGAYSDDYYVYYGHSNAGSPPTNKSNIYFFYDDFEDGNINGWNTYGNGIINIYQEAGGNYAIMKNGTSTSLHNDPNGGYIQLPEPITDYELRLRTNRINTDGGSQNRYGVENSSYDGYGFQLTNPAGGSGDQCIETRTGGSGGDCDVASQTVSPTSSNTWYEVRFRRYGNDKFEFDVYNSSGLMQTITGNNSDHPGPYDRLLIHGGYDFLTDDISMMKYMNNSPSTSTGNEQEWIKRNSTNSTGMDGLWTWMVNLGTMALGNYSAASLGEKTNYTSPDDYDSFILSQDALPPKVNLSSPSNGSSSNSSVTFSYYVNDTLSTVLNCSLIIDGEVDDTDDSIMEGPVQYFYPRIPSGGWHNWSVNCTDYYGNIGASESWEIWIKPPDLKISRQNISFNNTSPREGDNIRINATVYNLGGSNANNVTIQFWLGDPESGGSQLNGNFTANITDRYGDRQNQTFSINWTVTGPGPFRFFVVADPPTSINGSILELNETNNKANKTLHVPSYNYFHGSVTNNIYLSDIDNNSLYYYLDITNITGNVFVIDDGSSVNFNSLQALGRDINNNSVSNDFNESDQALNMTNYNDSIRWVFTHNTDTPLETRSFTIYDHQINNVPVVDSTNTSNFKTGIFWDTADGGTQYSGSQDLVFATEINIDQAGAYGTYDYEIKVPVNLKELRAAGSGIRFYWEIN